MVSWTVLLKKEHRGKEGNCWSFLLGEGLLCVAQFLPFRKTRTWASNAVVLVRGEHLDHANAARDIHGRRGGTQALCSPGWPRTPVIA